MVKFLDIFKYLSTIFAMDWKVFIRVTIPLTHLTRAENSFKNFLDFHDVALPLIQGDNSVTPNSPQDFVDAHNTAREEVGVSPLVWDETVAAYAQKYANERSKDCELRHSGGPYGENVAEGSWDLSAKEAVGMWIHEKNLYDYDSNTCVGGRECRHYTQVVRRDSARVGCARARCLNGWTFVVCNYDPPGNFIGERPF